MSILQDIPTDKQRAILKAQEWMARDPLFLDTETTGLDHTAEACEIAVVNTDGLVVFHSLVKPTRPIPTDATGIHGITDEMVKDAPTFAEVAPTLWEKLSGHLVIAYNANYDSRIIMQSEHISKAPGRTNEQGWNWGCAMHLYARYRGDWNERRHQYRWQTLGAAAQQCGIVVHADLHRAQADVEICRRIVAHVAETKA